MEWIILCGGGALLMVYAVMRLFSRNPLSENEEELRFSEQEELQFTAPPEADHPKNFGQECIWLAVRTRDRDAVAGALDIRAAHPENWENGLQFAANDALQNVFISPFINEWVMVIGKGLPLYDPNDTRSLRFLEHFSERFEEVQYFGVFDSIGYYAWLKIQRGNFVRCFAALGSEKRILINQGPLSLDEHRLNNEFSSIDSDYIFRLAAIWSINPNEIERLYLEEALGISASLVL